MNSYGEQIEKQVLCTAFSATCEKRKSIFSKDDIETTLHLVSNDLHMAELWGAVSKKQLSRNFPDSVWKICEFIIMVALCSVIAS